MAEDPVTIVKGGTMAQTILASAPEGMLIAPSWKRVLAFMLDVMLITIVLGFFTNFRLLEGLYSLCLLYTSPSPRDRTRSRMPSSA